MTVEHVTDVIEPSDSGGHAVLVSSSDQVWWKWYGSRADAGAEATQIGLADRHESPSSDTRFINVQYEPKNDATADPDELLRFGFRQRPSL
jgi:hypothetical protein